MIIQIEECHQLPDCPCNFDWQQCRDERKPISRSVVKGQYLATCVTIFSAPTNICSQVSDFSPANGLVSQAGVLGDTRTLYLINHHMETIMHISSISNNVVNQPSLTSPIPSHVQNKDTNSAANGLPSTTPNDISVNNPTSTTVNTNGQTMGSLINVTA